jgi:predicted enzyme related to lactoylglutathione lyase
MERETYAEGVPSWVDVSTPDTEKASAFYSALFGWEVPDLPPEAGGYKIAQIGGKSIAGIGPQQAPGPSAWMTYVNVADADATAAKVSANGGQVFAPPFDVMDVGRMGIFADPAGAVFGIWQPRSHKGAGLVNEPNTFVWNELVTTDTETSRAFYGAVFGWNGDTHGSGVGDYTEWKVDGAPVGGMMEKPATMPAEIPSHWLVYFAVDDTDKAVERIGELGGGVLQAPMDIEPGRFAVVQDPAGAVFGIIKTKGEA